MSRRVVVTSRAQAKLDDQADYLAEQGAIEAADNLHDRFGSFLRDHLAWFPRTSRSAPDGELRETWIPGTQLVIWYEFDDDTLTVIDVWHSRQDRQ